MTYAEFVASPLWVRLSAKYGWTEETLARVRAYRKAVAEALAGKRNPHAREMVINRMDREFLLAKGFSEDAVWKHRYAARLCKPAFDPMPSAPDRLTDLMMVSWLAHDGITSDAA